MKMENIYDIFYDNQFPIQPSLEYGNNYCEKKIEWNPITKNTAIFYQFSLNKGSKKEIQIVPDGCIDIIFCCNPDNPKAMLYGKKTRSRLITIEEGYEYFGFRPYDELGIKQKIALLKELNDSEADYNELYPEDFFIIEKICGQNSFEAKISLFQEYLKNRLIDFDYNSDFVFDCNDKICRSNGNMSTNDLSKYIGYSERYIQKKFDDLFGISPKQYSEIIKLQRSLFLLFKSSHDQSDITYELGYYDQPHLINKYRQMGLDSPIKFKDSILNSKQYNY